MATAKEADIASAFLRGLNAPDTPAMRLAVTAWTRMESGRTIIGNNPWNISLPAANEIARRGGPAPTSFRVHSVTGQKFAVYGNVEDGSRAAAILLTGAGSDWRGYDKVVVAARRSDPVGFLNALAASAWDAGRYGTKNGGTNKLLGVYKSVGGTGDVNLSAPAIVAGIDFSALTPDKLEALGIPTDPNHVLTQDEALKIAKEVFPGNVGTAYAILANKRVSALGSLQSGAASDDPMRELGDAATAISGFVGAVLDPGNWVRILALAAGVALVAYGGSNVLRSAA